MKPTRCEYIDGMRVYSMPKIRRKHRVRNTALAFAGAACLYVLATAPIIHSGYEYKGRWTTAFIGAPGSETVNDVIANNNLPEAYFGDSAVDWGKIIRQHNPQIKSIHQITEPIEVPLPEDAAKPENLKPVRTSVYRKLSAFLR